ncbi:MAG: hypothetical protein LBM93_15780 [Oscillospiraceae bacterium]|jgi:hypothetical protein|nr:hypothetical protein [Oscillospiraceae bacterium]
MAYSIQLIFEHTTKPHTVNYVFEPFSYEDKENGVTLTINNDWLLVIKKNEPINNSKLRDIIENVCLSLSMLLAQQNTVIGKYHPNISFDITTLKSYDEKGNGKDTSSVYRPTYEVGVTLQFAFENFPQFYSQVGTKEFYVFKGLIYAALRSRDTKSKYFNLFTIIEYIEEKKLGSITTTKLFNDKEIKFIEDNFSDSKKDRLLQLMNDKKTTRACRKEKLQMILSECYDIQRNKSDLKAFIDNRNKLFHGKQEVDEAKLIELINNLLGLCLDVLVAESNMPSDKKNFSMPEGAKIDGETYLSASFGADICVTKISDDSLPSANK